MTLISLLPHVVFDIMVVGGMIGYVASMYLNLSVYDVPLKGISIISLMFGIYAQGAISEHDAYKVEIEQAKAKIAQIEAKGAEKTVEIVTKYVDRVQVIKEKGSTIYEKIPTYITQKSDDRCIVPNGFVVLHDSAAKNEIPGTTGAPNEGASEVKISRVAEVVVDNYTTYHEIAEQLKALQGWVRAQQQIYNK